MTRTVTIALDGMGGDRAPDVIVKGANVARQRYPEVRFLLYGDEARLTDLLGRFPKLAACCEVRHAEDTIESHTRAVDALRQGRRSSMRLAIEAVRDREALGVVSAGNTGALMAMSKVVLRMLPGIHRPAIASPIPTEVSEAVMLDLGANIDCTADNLVQFAVMGEVFARCVFGIERPKVGIANVGSEEVKGNETVRAAARMLQEEGVSLSFKGFIEGDEIMKGVVDVVVVDGFSGNIALKLGEGILRLYTGLLRDAFRSTWRSRLGYLLAKPALAAVRQQLDPRRYNGGIFLGLNGVVVKSHGGTDVFGFANAIGVAYDMARGGFIEQLTEGINLIHARHAQQSTAAAV